MIRGNSASCLAAILAAAAAVRGADSVDYVRDVKPILSESCYTCHGPDEQTREADLRLDVRQSAVSAAILPGDPAASELIARVTSDDPDVRMPPPESRRAQLSPAQVEVVRRWIAAGADYQQHWAYVSPRRPRLPHVNAPTWTANPIDRFILAQLEQEQLAPSPRADARTLIRRVHFDLLGLAPTPEVVDQYANRLHSDPLAYGQLVDLLLASPSYGERMTAYWLDVVRYADSVGIHGDQEVSMSPYRDYVLSAMNGALPYDQFLTEQIAGDLLPRATQEQKIASAFNRLHMITSEGGAQAKEYLAIYDADRVRNTSAALLGTTLGCAQCHDHKFDPFTTRDFYEFASFFADLKEAGVYGGSNWFPRLPVPTPEQAARMRELDDAVATAATAEAAEDDAHKKRLADLKQQREEFEKTIRTVLVSQSVEPREIRVLPRGNWLDDSGPVVRPDVPETLSIPEVSAPSERRASRLDLARWLTHSANPLVARVYVNRLWKLMFGEGIVTSLDDFGSQGSRPSHPELLDWLATEFVRSGWDAKHILRLIVTSRTYQQSSQPTPELRRRDPTNRWLARQNRFRLDAESIRDNALAASGLLVNRLGGPSVRPYQPDGYYDHLNFPRRNYQPSEGADLYRRSVYTHWQRTFLHPSLMAFDAPSREECAVKRPRSNTPLQSLVLLNDPIYVEAARKLAERLLRPNADDNDERRLRRAYELVLQRAPTDEEQEVLLALVARHRRHYQEHPDAAREVLKNGRASAAADVGPAESAAWTSAARAILTLHETITRS